MALEVLLAILGLCTVCCLIGAIDCESEYDVNAKQDAQQQSCNPSSEDQESLMPVMEEESTRIRTDLDQLLRHYQRGALSEEEYLKRADDLIDQLTITFDH